MKNFKKLLYIVLFATMMIAPSVTAAEQVVKPDGTIFETFPSVDRSTALTIICSPDSNDSVQFIWVVGDPLVLGILYASENIHGSSSIVNPRWIALEHNIFIAAPGQVKYILWLLYAQSGDLSGILPIPWRASQDFTNAATFTLTVKQMARSIILAEKCIK